MRLIHPVSEREPRGTRERFENEHVGSRGPPLLRPRACDCGKRCATADGNDDEAAGEGGTVRMRTRAFVAMNVRHHRGLCSFERPRRHAHDHFRTNRLRNRIGLAARFVVELLAARQDNRNAVHVAGFSCERGTDANHFFLGSGRAQFFHRVRQEPEMRDARCCGILLHFTSAVGLLRGRQSMGSTIPRIINVC